MLYGSVCVCVYALWLVTFRCLWDNGCKQHTAAHVWVQRMVVLVVLRACNVALLLRLPAVKSYLYCLDYRYLALVSVAATATKCSYFHAQLCAPRRDVTTVLAQHSEARHTIPCLQVHNTVGERETNEPEQQFHKRRSTTAYPTHFFSLSDWDLSSSPSLTSLLCSLCGAHPC